MSDKPLTVKSLREALETMPQDFEVWVRLEGVADYVTHIKLGAIGGVVRLILQCEPWP